MLITAIGVSYFLQSLSLLLFGSDKKPFPSAFSIPNIELGELMIPGDAVLTLAVTILIMIALSVFISKTRLGKAMRAVSEDKDAAELMGISVNKTITLTFAIGSALAAVAGVFFGSMFGFVGPYSGSMPGIKAFVAAVLGGIGSIPGAMLGGIMLGLIENLSKAYISGELADAIVFGMLIIILLVKPTGILGKKVTERYRGGKHKKQHNRFLLPQARPYEKKRQKADSVILHGRRDVLIFIYSRTDRAFLPTVQFPARSRMRQHHPRRIA